MSMNRRSFLAGAAAFAVGGRITALPQAQAADRERDSMNNKGPFPVTLSKEEWRKRLTDQQFKVLRKHATEPPFSSPLYEEKRDGSYLCVACDQLLFLSEQKYHSGTGWPSFWQPANDKSVGTSKDYKLILPRTEVHCARCGGHLGHVFTDGPQPTGLRYCINGVTLKFVPDAAG